MYIDHFTATHSGDTILLCPDCGSCEGHEDNRIDEALYVQAAREAPRLRHEGRMDEVIELLSALYALRIINFIRHRWRCTCGVSFDG